MPGRSREQWFTKAANSSSSSTASGVDDYAEQTQACFRGCSKEAVDEGRLPRVMDFSRIFQCFSSLFKAFFHEILRVFKAFLRLFHLSTSHPLHVFPSFRQEAGQTSSSVGEEGRSGGLPSIGQARRKAHHADSEEEAASQVLPPIGGLKRTTGRTNVKPQTFKTAANAAL